MAAVSPLLTVATEATVRPGTAVSSMKLDFVTPLTKVVLVSVTVTVALFKLDSTSVVGFVAVIAAEVRHVHGERQGVAVAASVSS